MVGMNEKRKEEENLLLLKTNIKLSFCPMNTYFRNNHRSVYHRKLNLTNHCTKRDFTKLPEPCKQNFPPKKDNERFFFVCI